MPGAKSREHVGIRHTQGLAERRSRLDRGEGLVQVHGGILMEGGGQFSVLIGEVTPRRFPSCLPLA